MVLWGDVDEPEPSSGGIPSWAQDEPTPPRQWNGTHDGVYGTWLIYPDGTWSYQGDPRAPSQSGGGSTSVTVHNTPIQNQAGRYITAVDDTGGITGYPGATYQQDTYDGSITIINKGGGTASRDQSGYDPKTGLPYGVVKVDKDISWTGLVYQGIPVKADGSPAGPPPPGAPKPRQTSIVQTSDGSDWLIDSQTGEKISQIGGPTPVRSSSTSSAVTPSSAYSSGGSGGSAAQRDYPFQHVNLPGGGVGVFNPNTGTIQSVIAGGEEEMTPYQQAQLALQYEQLGLSRAAAERQAAQDARDFKLRAAREFANVISLDDPLALPAFLAAGGGDVSNALAAGATALSPAALLPAAQILQMQSGQPNPVTTSFAGNPFGIPGLPNFNTRSGSGSVGIPRTGLGGTAAGQLLPESTIPYGESPYSDYLQHVPGYNPYLTAGPPPPGSDLPGIDPGKQGWEWRQGERVLGTNGQPGYWRDQGWYIPGVGWAPSKEEYQSSGNVLPTATSPTPIPTTRPGGTTIPGIAAGEPLTTQQAGDYAWGLNEYAPDPMELNSRGQTGTIYESPQGQVDPKQLWGGGGYTWDGSKWVAMARGTMGMMGRRMPPIKNEHILVGEQGPELISNPRGAPLDIVNTPATMEMMMNRMRPRFMAEGTIGTKDGVTYPKSPYEMDLGTVAPPPVTLPDPTPAGEEMPMASSISPNQDSFAANNLLSAMISKPSAVQQPMPEPQPFQGVATPDMGIPPVSAGFSTPSVPLTGNAWVSGPAWVEQMVRDQGMTQDQFSAITPQQWDQLLAHQTPSTSTKAGYSAASPTGMPSSAGLPSYSPPPVVNTTASSTSPATGGGLVLDSKSPTGATMNGVPVYANGTPYVANQLPGTIAPTPGGVGSPSVPLSTLPQNPAGYGVSPLNMDQLNIDPSLIPYMEQVLGMRTTAQMPDLNPYDVTWESMDPILRNLFLKGRSARTGISPETQLFDIYKQRLQGASAPSVIGY